ncbi:hypothetical protein MPH_07805 [Macrophomina phaseolina MS6]|uniref:Uncharacterized protein n=1 Tax=Macrophomina phaseolina (strain MS6) TaxID=1126212 RepID=K2QYL3_MACPH|nr:hypothetical protein MPH_07805 [Macrophomina phaseolina MS6]
MAHQSESKPSCLECVLQGIPCSFDDTNAFVCVACIQEGKHCLSPQCEEHIALASLLERADGSSAERSARRLYTFAVLGCADCRSSFAPSRRATELPVPAKQGTGRCYTCILELCPDSPARWHESCFSHAPHTEFGHAKETFNPTEHKVPPPVSTCQSCLLGDHLCLQPRLYTTQEEDHIDQDYTDNCELHTARFEALGEEYIGTSEVAGQEVRDEVVRMLHCDKCRVSMVTNGIFDWSFNFSCDAFCAIDTVWEHNAKTRPELFTLLKLKVEEDTRMSFVAAWITAILELCPPARKPSERMEEER